MLIKSNSRLERNFLLTFIDYACSLCSTAAAAEKWSPSSESAPNGSFEPCNFNVKQQLTFDRNSPQQLSNDIKFFFKNL